jgi:coenzyme F420-reducing hydrogenase delta subunit
LRIKYSPNVRVVKLPCTGRITPLLLLKAIEEGADGVYAVGCKEGDCHYIDGNIKARRVINYVKKLLESIGIEHERVAMYNLSASDGPLFAEYANEFTEIINNLGPVYKDKEAANA